MLELARITETAFDVAQLRLSKSRQREAELRAMVESLNISLRDRAKVRLAQTDAALVGGADVNWQIWVEQRRRSINVELAKCLAEQEKIRRDARHAFGRRQAINSLIERDVSALKQKAFRKSNYTS